jgi:hypothetical protein
MLPVALLITYIWVSAATMVVAACMRSSQLNDHRLEAGGFTSH